VQEAFMPSSICKMTSEGTLRLSHFGNPVYFEAEDFFKPSRANPRCMAENGER
jgi:hypothetical protein